MSIPFFKKIFTPVFSILLIAGLHAQTNKTNFKGMVVDESDLPVPGATIMILDPKDSTLVQFGSSDPQGAFLIKNVAKGEYLFNINFLAHAPFYQAITSGVTEEVDLGKLKLEPAGTVLTAVEIKADIVPVEITKDTISYNADAFETQPNANVEDLLKKLPGMEVGADGSIKAQGEDVQKVLVDGKEFFGDDPKMATKNLPAKSIKKVKVYDKQSDMAEFTGVDDGTRMKTIDLQLKEEFKKGLFGTAQAGYGTDTRYNAKASINRFSKTSQLSFLGQLNNINEQGFSFSDRMNFTGGMMGMSGGGGSRSIDSRSSGSGSSVPISDGTSNGLVNTGAAGLNFNYQKNKNFNVRSSYFYNAVEKDLLQNTYRQNLTENPYNSDEDLDQNTKNHSNNVTLNSDVQLDSTSQIQLVSKLGFGNGNSDIQSFLQNISAVTISDTLNQSNTLSNNTDDNLTLNAGATYMKRLGNKGRNFSINGTYTKNDDNTESGLQALTEYFTTGDNSALNQLQNTTSNDNKMDAQLSYTEPLHKRRFLEFNYLYSKFDANYDKLVSDITDSSSVINPILTTDYNSVFQFHRPGVTFRYSGEVHNLNVGLNYQISDLTGHIQLGENEIKRNYNHFLPRVIWRYDIGNGKNLRFSYTTRVNAPSITQLSPVVDNSDPLRLYVGNPKLNAEYNHQLNLNYHSFSQFSSTAFFASINSTITENKIITSRTVDDKFRELSTPVNINDETRIGFYTNFGRPFKPIHSRFSINANISYTNTQNFIDTVLIDVNRWTRAAGITFTNMNSKVLEYNLGGEWTTTGNYYKQNDALNQNTLLSNYFVDATVTLWKKWKVQGSYDYNLYSSDQFADNQSLGLMEFSISRFILPMDRGQLKFSIFDVLDENRGISRTADINYIQEVNSNSIGRYAMFSFIYSIRGMNQPGQGPGGMFRMIEQRH
jgi:hypothetical protein